MGYPMNPNYGHNQGYIDENNNYVGPEDTIYINDVEFFGGKVDSVMIMQSNSPRGTEKTINVILSPVTLKAISKVTSNFVEVYEEDFGKIPELEMNSGYVSEENE
ncbi:hypothetical protein [Mammaliicoccus sciuri]|uniref:hypothetical protein n=1 Tax=Mammaliicoccus sciuri TaxID=1296 RepID=UPI002DB6F28A|nr:hypothetical protein [Mammaliicoccus sciuri]MEB6122792.1 hypothetical protein [Mammaliicoccus sciuri]MEB6313021.1 hypothetical protein [Mammaliicoccus sciuri]MEB6696527.1 hypothetical protein [Mammaliicoccus sciuri]